MLTHFAIGGDEADALELQRAVTALVAGWRIGSACEIQCRRLNADDGVRPNATVFRRDTGLKNRCRFQPPGMVHGSDRTSAANSSQLARSRNVVRHLDLLRKTTWPMSSTLPM
jgi:hypothetical protein